MAPLLSLPTFTWTYDGSDMATYFLQFSNTPDFQNTSATMAVLPKNGVTGLSYTVTAADWKAVKTLANANNGLVYWRVKGQDATKTFELWSNSWTFTIDGGAITLFAPVPNGDGTVT